MAIINFNFTKIDVEKSENLKGGVKISNNISITNIKKMDLPVKSDKQNVLEAEFSFITNYEPDIGKISLKGKLLYVGTKEEVEESLKQWEKEKKVQKEVMIKIMNYILDKCNIQAILLSQTVSLPCPVPLPKAKND